MELILAEQLYEEVMKAIEDKDYELAEKYVGEISDKYPEFFKGPIGEQRCAEVGYRLSIDFIDMIKRKV